MELDVENATKPMLKRNISFKEYLSQGGVLLIILILLLIVCGISSPDFLNMSNIMGILLQSSIIGCLALGETLIIISSGIDLSMGAMVAVASVVSALTQPYGVFVSCSLAILSCVAIGFTSGIFVAKGKVPPFITTLGIMGVAKGIALILSNGQIISGTTMNFRSIAASSVLGVPTPVIVLVVLTAGTWIFLKKTKWGAELYAVGGNEKAAKLSGINVNKVLITVYVLGGLFAGIAGILYTSRMTVGQASAGNGYEMLAIAGVIIGGASMNGGKGNAVNSIIGVLILGILSNYLNLMGVSPFIHEAVRGVIILAAVYYNMKREKK